MIATLVTLFMVLSIIGFSDKGDTGAIVGCVVVIAIAWFFHIVAMDDARAEINRTHYWLMSGKDRARARHRWEAEARAEETRERERTARKHEPVPVPVPDDRPTEAELLEAKRKREAYVEKLRRMNNPSVESGPIRVCHHCGRSVRAYGHNIWDGHRDLIEYRCPKCGRMNQTSLGS